MSSAKPHTRLPVSRLMFVSANDPAGLRNGAATKDPSNKTTAVAAAVRATAAGAVRKAAARNLPAWVLGEITAGTGRATLS